MFVWINQAIQFYVMKLQGKKITLTEKIDGIERRKHCAAHLLYEAYSPHVSHFHLLLFPCQEVRNTSV